MSTPYDLDRIFCEITVDKLFFEKIDIEVNRQIFMTTLDESKIKRKHSNFLQMLQNAGIDFFSNNANAVQMNNASKLLGNPNALIVKQGK